MGFVALLAWLVQERLHCWRKHDGGDRHLRSNTPWHAFSALYCATKACKWH